MKTSCTLIIDARERHVTRHDIEFANITYTIKQITTADYVVLAPGGNVLAAIERKTLEDFAASLKDGRASNKSKLIELRNTTGCRIIYLIEGPAYPDPRSYYGNIKYQNIESSIFHLMIRDGISVINTNDSLGSAQMLARLVLSMDSLVAKMEEPTIETLTPLCDIVNKEVSTADMVELLTKRVEKSDNEITRELWSCFPGISVETADEYSKKWSIGDIVCGAIPRTDINSHKLASGRAIGKKAAASLTAPQKLTEVRLLGTIPGISHAAAVELTNVNSLATILKYSYQALGMTKVGKARRCLGDDRARRILHLMHMRTGAPPHIRDDPGNVLNYVPGATINVQAMSL